MKRKIILDVDGKMNDEEVLYYKDGAVKAIDVRLLLPELKEIQADLESCKASIAEIRQTLAELAKIVKEK